MTSCVMCYGFDAGDLSGLRGRKLCCKLILSEVLEQNLVMTKDKTARIKALLRKPRCWRERQFRSPACIAIRSAKRKQMHWLRRRLPDCDSGEAVHDPVHVKVLGCHPIAHRRSHHQPAVITIMNQIIFPKECL